MPRKIIIICAGSQAKVTLDILNDQKDKFQIVGLIDSYKEIGSQFYGYEIIGRQDQLSKLAEKHGFKAGLITLGDNYGREAIAKDIRAQIKDFTFINAISKQAYISKTAAIGQGNTIMPGVVINSEAQIGNHCLVNTNSTLEHNGVMADFSSLSIGTNTGGYVSIGRYSAISIGATVLDRISIGENVVVGSGALVTKDLDDHALYYGVPAKRIRDRKPHEKFLN